MKRTVKYYLGTIREYNGEMEYNTHYLFKTDGCPDKYSDNVAKTWRGDEANEYDEDLNGYWSDNCVMCPHATKKIPVGHFVILKRYLPVL